MDSDISEQKAFFRSKEVPAAKAQRQVLPKKGDDRNGDVGTASDKTPMISMISPVGIIRERSVEKKTEEFDFKSTEHGFPTAEVVDTDKKQSSTIGTSKKSIFRQSMEEKAKRNQKKVFERNPTTEVVTHSCKINDSDAKMIERSFSKEVSSSDLKKDVDSLLGQMTPEDILKEREELLKSLDPSLVQFLLKRNEYKEKMNREVSTVRVNKSDDIENEEEKARRVANSVDYSQIRTEEDLDSAVSLLPEGEQLKLAWTHRTVSTPSSTDLRFHFDGFLLPVTPSSEIGPNSGLYHHGDDEDRPGYTLPELTILCRSAVSGQRVLSLKCIYNILRRRSITRIRQQTMQPAILSVTLPRTMAYLLVRGGGEEEVFLALRCLTELCTSKEEFCRDIIMNLHYRGYERASLQDADAIAFISDWEKEDANEEVDDITRRAQEATEVKRVADPFRAENCRSLYTMLYGADIISSLFSLLRLFSEVATVVTETLTLLRVLVDGDERFGNCIVDSTVLFSQLETLCKHYLNPTILPDAPLQPQPPADTASCRLFFISVHPLSSVAVALHVLSLLEAIVRRSRRNASNLMRSPLFASLKQWLVFYDVDQPTPVSASEINAVLEGVLTVWRLFLFYGFDVDAIDAFLPVLARISQYSSHGNRVLAWSILEAGIVCKKKTTVTYFVEYSNVLVMLAIEAIRDAATPICLLAAVSHFLASYVDTVNEVREGWGEEADEQMGSIQSQVLQLGYALMKRADTWLTELKGSYHMLCCEWKEMYSIPNLITSHIDVPSSSFSSTESLFILYSDAFLAVVRFLLAGIQNSMEFATVLQQTGWIRQLLDFSTSDLWSETTITPHSVTYTYMLRLLVLGQVNALLLLHTLMLSDVKETQDGESSLRARVWRSAWTVIQAILPGDEYVALELLLHVLLHPTSVKQYLGPSSENSELSFDLTEVTELLVQQLGEGKVVEHSQSLHFTSYTDRRSFHLIPFSIHPSLPLLPHWFLMPLLKLRFRKVGEPVDASPFVTSSPRHAVALLRFLYHLETSVESPLYDNDKPMRLYCVLHVGFAGGDVVSSSSVEQALVTLLKVYMRCDKKNGSTGCSIHMDCLNKMESLIPRTEMLSFLDKLCCLISEEYYVCPLVMKILLLYMDPCRDWNYRVLILNFFLDHDYAYILLEADSKIVKDLSSNNMKEESLSDLLSHEYKQYCSCYGCIWDENEEMMEMIIRYFEQACCRIKNDHYEIVFNRFMFSLLHYVQEKKPRFAFFEKELNRIFPQIDFILVLS